MTYKNRLKWTHETHVASNARNRNLHTVTGMARKSDGYLRKLRSHAKGDNLDLLKIWVGADDHYVVPARDVRPSFVSEVTTSVKSLQSIVDAMVGKADPVAVSVALSHYSKTLIIATGLATIQRLLSQSSDQRRVDERYIRRVLNTALLIKA